MKRAIAASAIILVSVFSINGQTAKEVTAPVKNVTVFPDRAQLTQEITVDITAGKNIIKLGALSPYIDQQSVQVKGTGEFTILSVNHQNNYLQNLEEQPEIKNLRSQIESLQLKIEDEKAAIAVLEEKEAFLIANRAILVKETTFSIEQLKNVMELYTNNMEQVATTILKKNRLIKDYEKQIAQLQKQLNDKAGMLQLPSGEISVTAEATKPIQAKLIFSYVVMNAGWYPTYDIRVDDITKPVTIIYKANLYQNTGIEWKNVKLSFSNATPWVSGNLPILSPWFIDYFVYIPAMIRSYDSDKSAPRKAEMMSEAMVSEAKSIEDVVAMAPAVQKQTGETTITFDVSTPYTVSADGKIQTIEIQRTSSPATYKYVTTPKLSDKAYLTANITEWAKQSLIGGEATLYFENTFVGNSFLNVNQMTDTLILSLGIDNSIILKREKRQDFTSKRVIGANKTETFSFLITVRNNKQTPVKIVVSDQLPISANSGITVEAIELTGGKHDQATGLVKWELDIKPQETKQLILTYSVKYPKDKTVILE